MSFLGMKYLSGGLQSEAVKQFSLKHLNTIGNILSTNKALFVAKV